MKIELEMCDLMNLLKEPPVSDTDNFITVSIIRPGHLRGYMEIRMNVKHDFLHETKACCIDFYEFQRAKEETKKEIIEYTLNEMTRYFAKEVFGCYTNPESK